MTSSRDGKAAPEPKTQGSPSEATGRSGVIGYFVRHPTAANLIMAIMILVGLAAATQIRAQFFPDIVRETITVRVPWSGAGPEDVDQAIIATLEPSLRAVEGVEETKSLAREGRASVVLEFESGADLGAAADEIEAAVDAITTLPDSADDPEIARGRYRDRVTNIIIAGDVPLDLLNRYAEELKEALFARGITRVEILGFADPLIRIEPSEAALQKYALSLSDVASAVAAEVEARPAGTLGDAGARIRAGVARKSIEALGEIVVRAGADGSKLLLRDIATIREEGPDRGKAYFRDGVRAVQMRVDRSASGDSIRIQHQIEEAVAQMQPTLPEGVAVKLTRTRSQYIQDRLDLLLDNAGMGLLVVLTFLFLFLSARSAFWVAAGIPVSLLATVALMYALGLTINVISLFGLLIALGIIVDDAIVVSEHADKLRRAGMSAEAASTQAARRMAGPVFSASITTVLAFAGLVFVGGRFGDLIIDLPKALIVILLISLIECFLILPAHMRHALEDRHTGGHWYDVPATIFNRGFRFMRERGFRPLVALAMRFRIVVICTAIALLVYSSALFASGQLRWFFFHAPERGAVTANIAMVAGATRADTQAMLEEMRRALKVTDEKFFQRWKDGDYTEDFEGEPQHLVTESIYLLGGYKGRPLAGSETKDTDLLGGFEIELLDSDMRPFRQQEFVEAWRAEIREMPLLETLAVRGMRGGPGGDAIDIEIFGPDPRVLKAAAEQLKAELSRFAQVGSLEDTMPYDRPELTLTLTPLGEALGFTTASIGAELRARLNGITAAQFARDGKEVEIQVSLPEDVLDAGLIDRTFVPIPGRGAGSNATAALSDIVTVREERGFASISRLDGRVLIQVTGDMTDDPAARAEVKAALTDRILPQLEAQFAVQTDQGGLAEQEREFLSDAALGFGLCLIGIYLTLSWVFGSWLRPFIVLLIIPFGLIGTLWGHHWFGVPLSMFSVVGMIGMAGIIINDSIVLVTTIDEHAPRRPMMAAVVDGTVERLRAVMLTTLTTIGGLAPLLLDMSQQAMFLKPTVITLCFGLGFGMFLVLFVTPAMVLIQHDIAMAVRSARRMRRHLLRRRPALGSAARKQAA
ncbi:MAG: efflux RND transporter permease subunit [Neomegalonema sp.]|nr:efflux RND transporter permease subunit [Neomegalonema sp.]